MVGPQSASVLANMLHAIGHQADCLLALVIRDPRTTTYPDMGRTPGRTPACSFASRFTGLCSRCRGEGIVFKVRLII